MHTARPTWKDYTDYLERVGLGNTTDYARGSSPFTEALNDFDGFTVKQRRMTHRFNAHRRTRRQRRSVTKR